MSEIDTFTRHMIDRLRSVSRKQPVWDMPRVARSLRAHFRAIQIPRRPIQFVSDAVEGYAIARSTAHPAASSVAEFAAETLTASGAERPARSIVWEAIRTAAWSAADGAAAFAARSEVARVLRAPGLQVGREVVAWSQPWFAVPLNNRTNHHCAIWAPFLDAYEAGLWIYWFMKDRILAVMRPALHIAEGRLHRADGPAVSWPNGTAFWFWRGVRVPQQVVQAPAETLTPKQILREPNAEVRRVMIERVGLDRLLSTAHAECIDTDESGHRRLYRLRLGLHEPLSAVRVRCPSTGQIYFLRVPPTMGTCRQAVAWTFGFERVEEYQPKQEA